MTSITGHPALDGFAIADGDLVIGGIPLSRLVERVGRTPFFAYDRTRLDARIAHLRRCLPARLRLHYAVKANPMPAVVQHLASAVDGFDVASAGEMKVVLDAPVVAANVSFAGPGKRRSELRQAIAAGVIIHMESESEMQILAEEAENLGIRPRVAIRVNPDFEIKGVGMRMGGGAQQFGVDAERVPQMLGELGKMDLEFIGFHFFTGSQNLRADHLTEAQRRVIDLAIALSEYAPAPVRHLNIGGGFGIPYFPNDKPLDLEPVGEGLARLLDRLDQALPEAQPIIELGRYIVGEAGVYVARVVDRKESRGQVFLVTDGGLNHHLAASGNFGQVIRRNYPVVIGNRMNEPVLETATVVGCLCTPLDVLAEKVQLPEARIGDFVVVLQSGAYGRTASPSAFLSHPEASEVLV